MPTLRQWRIKKLWTMRDLSAASGVALQTVYGAEHGKPLRMFTMKKIADALGVDAWDIDEFAATLTVMGDAEDEQKKLAA
jgi:transcriptional regulator with XRE-family HTH domain